jgi:hypothetical protein
MNPKNLLILAALGVAGYYFLTRRASAAPLPANTAGQSPYARRQGFPVTTQQSPAGRAGGELAGTIGAIGQLWNSITSPAITRPAGYDPTYTPDSSGEAPARQYYIDNKDSFAVNPPDQYSTYTDQYEGIDSR